MFKKDYSFRLIYYVFTKKTVHCQQYPPIISMMIWRNKLKRLFIGYRLHQLHNKKGFSDFFHFLFVNWAGQMSASQTGPKNSKIKSYIFNIFYCLADVEPVFLVLRV